MLVPFMMPARLKSSSEMIAVYNADISILVWKCHRRKKKSPKPTRPKRNTSKQGRSDFWMKERRR
jgi:hypothetical protein